MAGIARRLPRGAAPIAAALLALACAGPARALQTCELGGQPVDPNNGATTAGQTGLMRCRDADSGAPVRDQELRDGRFVGIVRHYREGRLEREFSVDARGNRDGLSREWHVESDGRRTLVREETDRDSRAVGLVRTWYPSGPRRRLAFLDDDGREQAAVEFDTEGRLRDLRCGPRPVFGTEFDDRSACGHAGAVSTVVLLGSRGEPVTRIAFERGERRRVESLGPDGTVREVRETTAAGALLRRLADDGTTLYEAQWVVLPARADAAASGARGRSVKVLEQTFHASGQRVRETRWTPPADERGGAELASESTWYLNGQPKERTDHEEVDGVRLRHERRFHDNGQPAFDGRWRIGGAGAARFDRSERPTGSHRSFDERGRLRSESLYDDRGRITREREFDADGTPTRDDEVYEDGSRKSTAR